MSNVTIYFRDGTIKLFEDRGAPGGSYHSSVRYEGNFVIHQDAYGNQIAYPMDTVMRVEKEGERRGISGDTEHKMSLRDEIEKEACNMENSNYSSTAEYRDALTRIARLAATEAANEALPVPRRQTTIRRSENTRGNRINKIVAKVLGEEPK